MKIVGAIFGFLVLAVVFVIWLKAYRRVKSENDSLAPAGKRNADGEKASLEDFIASYKRGEIKVASSVPATANPASVPLPSPAVAAAVPPSPPLRREAFISGSTKLAYLTCKAGLRDHHVFAHVRLSALSTGDVIDPMLARGGVDLLICNAAMSAVAAVDLVDAGNAPTNAAKASYLKALDIRYLRLSAKSLPRPQEWHALLYKM